MVTVVTLYDDGLAEHYVAVVQGKISKKDRKRMAKAYNAEYGVKDEQDDGRYLYFAEVPLHKHWSCAKDMPNIFGK